MGLVGCLDHKNHTIACCCLCFWSCHYAQYPPHLVLLSCEIKSHKIVTHDAGRGHQQGPPPCSCWYCKGFPKKKKTKRVLGFHFDRHSYHFPRGGLLVEQISNQLFLWRPSWHLLSKKVSYLCLPIFPCNLDEASSDRQY